MKCYWRTYISKLHGSKEYKEQIFAITLNMTRRNIDIGY